MVDTCHPTFDKACGRHSMKTEPYHKLWALVGGDVSMWVRLWWRMLRCTSGTHPESSEDLF